MKKNKRTIPLSFVASDLDEILAVRRLSNIGDINKAVKVMMAAAIKNYFLSIPNPNAIEHLDESIDVLKPAMELIYTREWYSTIFTHCERILEKYFDRWANVTWRIHDNVLFIRSSGDFRIEYYHNTFGIGRVGSELGKPLEAVAEVADPFFVADNIDATIDRDVYNATKYDFSDRLADTPDYLILGGTEHRRY